MKINNGDSVILGKKWCKENYRKYTGSPILLTIQYFEYDNGLYTENQSCLGIYNEDEKEADSIYHLFGNNFEHFRDCTLIKATPESIAEFNRIEKEHDDVLNAYWEMEAECMEKYMTELIRCDDCGKETTRQYLRFEKGVCSDKNQCYSCFEKEVKND